MDRNPFSNTFGSMHRDFWLDKTSDFSDAVRQFGLHALALIYNIQIPNNLYFKNNNVLDWIVAGLKFWGSIQHKDGSFDEFYPNERGWVGPTAFTTYSTIETFDLIKDKISLKDQKLILDKIYKSALFISGGDNEEDHLANHHAMASLSLWKAYKLFEEKKFLKSYQKSLKIFSKYHDFSEGWSIEYDGIDPGYLSATVSFLGKIYKDNNNEEIFNICKKSIEMCSYFIFPNGFYGGSVGSRNTQHFYSHGFEIFGNQLPLALSMANKMLISIKDNKVVPPEIISDRYLVYRIPEYLLSYEDFCKRPKIYPKITI